MKTLLISTLTFTESTLSLIELYGGNKDEIDGLQQANLIIKQTINEYEDNTITHAKIQLERALSIAKKAKAHNTVESRPGKKNNRRMGFIGRMRRRRKDQGN